MGPHIHLYVEPHDAYKQQLQAKLDGVAISYGETPPAETTILVMGYPTEKQLSACPNLKSVVIPFTGISQETLKVLQPYPDLLLYNMHFQAEIVAEGAMILLLALSRNVCRNDGEMRKGRWPARHEEMPPPTLHGKTAVVLGFGAIGREIGRLCSLFDMKVIGLTRSGQSEGCLPISSLRDVLPQADVLFIAAPSTSETRNLIGEAELALLKPQAMIVNIARADIFEEEALYEALKKRAIHGAALDVWWNSFDEEGKFFNFPFNELDNVILSPHITWRTEQTEPRRFEVLGSLLERLVAGDPPKPVDKALGY
ncbi:MAG TPA: NAD(P)-dependent oxidoreductase [Fimbriimonadaceae bacterium]|jgi:phosphoglycerate dehydrogenase-like enzyme